MPSFPKQRRLQALRVTVEITTQEQPYGVRSNIHPSCILILAISTGHGEDRTR